MRKMYVLCLAVLMAFLVYSPIAMAVPPVTTGLVLDLDTSDITTTVRSGVTYVTTWNDQSGNFNDAAQAAEANQPTLVSNVTVLGGSAVKFDGTNDYLSMVPNSTFDGGDWTIIAVYASSVFDSGSGGDRIINFGYDDIDSDPGITKAHPTVYTMIASGANYGDRATSRTWEGTGVFASAVPTPGYAVNTFYTGIATINEVSGDVSAYFVNSAGLITSGTANTLQPSHGIGNRLALLGCGTVGASSWLPGSFFNGWLAEVLVYNRVLDSTERASVIAYLGAKHMPFIQAYNPTPANGGSITDRSTNLKWIPAGAATSQSLYCSATFNDVNTSAPAALKATLAGDVNTYGVDTLQLSTTYYWRINQVVGGVTIPGTIWSFNVGSYYNVEIFENYVGTGSSTIPGSLRAAWADGYSLGAGNQLGSNVVLVNEVNGVSDTIYDANTHSGYQSMLFAFDNTGNPITFAYPAGSVTYTPVHPYAEAKVNISSLPFGTNWATAGDLNLNVYFAGKTTNDTSSPLYLAVEDAAGHVCTPIVYPTSSDIAVPGFHTWVICAGDLATNGVDMANLSKLYIGLGNRNTPQVGGKGVIYIDDFRLYRQPKIATDLNQDCKVDFKDFNLLALDWMQHAGCVN
jgi:hypothetical protein